MPTKENMEIVYSVAVDEELKWKLFVRGKEISDVNVPESLKSVPPAISSLTQLRKILDILNTLHVCEGNADEKYLPLLTRKKKFYDISGKKINLFISLYTHVHVHTSGHTVTAFEDVSSKGVTIRNSKCELLFDSTGKSVRCKKCAAFRRILNAMIFRYERTQRISR